MNDIQKRICIDALNTIDLDAISKKRFLVVGATSFLGLSIIRSLVFYNEEIATCTEKQCTIYGLYRDARKVSEAFENIRDRDYLKLIQWDALNKNKEIIIDDHIDYVFYLCSIATTDQFKKMPVETMLLNTVGLNSILDFSIKHDVKSVLYFSSGAIYGNVPEEVNDICESDHFIMDHMSLDNVYGEGKRAGEALCNSYFAEYSLPVKIIRISHTYGPGINLNDGRIFSDFVKDILNKEDLLIKGDGKASRPFCYISDALRAFFLISFKGENGKAYNMANPHETYTVSELAEKLVKEAFAERNLSVIYKRGKPLGITHKPLINIGMLNALGWTPVVDVNEGFKETVDYYTAVGWEGN